jgi:hypothetical protein
LLIGKSQLTQLPMIFAIIVPRAATASNIDYASPLSKSVQLVSHFKPTRGLFVYQPGCRCFAARLHLFNRQSMASREDVERELRLLKQTIAHCAPTNQVCACIVVT